MQQGSEGKIPAEEALNVILGLIADLRDRDRLLAENSPEAMPLSEVRRVSHMRIDALEQEYSDHRQGA
jgi:hypothetical protein